MAKLLPFRTSTPQPRPRPTDDERGRVLAINLNANNPLQELVLLAFASLRAKDDEDNR